MDYAKESLRLHGEWGGKIEVVCTVPCKTKEDLSLAYTPGVAQPCLEIQKDVNKSYELTRRHNLCAVITDGTAETDRSAQVCVNCAMATQPVQILAKPGMGVDEGYMIVYNEMERILALRAAKKALA